MEINGRMLPSNSQEQQQSGQEYDYSSLFLGDLSTFCTEKDIYLAFQSYGQITDIRLRRSKEEGKCLGFAFLTFADCQAAARALSEMNGQLILGRTIRVNWATKKGSTGVMTSQNSPQIEEETGNGRVTRERNYQRKRNPQKNPLKNAQLHFSFISKQVKPPHPPFSFPSSFHHLSLSICRSDSL